MGNLGETLRNAPHLRTKMLQLAVMGSVLLGLGLFQNCSGVGFSAGQDNSSNNGLGNGGNATGNLTQNSCNNNQLQQSTTPIKIILVVDVSGSNQGDASSPGTDPGKVARAGSIQAFFNDYGAKANFNWAFITFQNASASAILNNAGNNQQPEFTSNPQLMQAAITYFENNVPDNGQTPYKAAIQMATGLIQNDGADTAQTKYIVVFLSDGMPTDYQSDSQIYSDVTALVNLKPGRISFNTVFYGQPDPSASSRLNMMANAGSGQFLDTNATGNKDFLINNVVTVPGSQCTP